MRAITLRNKPFYIHDNEDLSNAIERNGDYWEADILDWLAVNRQHQGLILDIGANIGNHSHYFGSYLTYKKLVAFEPDDENFALLDKNLEFIKAWLAPVAVSNVKGIIELHKNANNWGAHEVHDTPGYRTVSTIRLDDEEWPDLTLMKIDVEWHEPQVLEGAKETIAKWEPSILIEDVGNAYWEILEPMGYRLMMSWEHHKTYLWET
jgi:FkbM family methyltransferase